MKKKEYLIKELETLKKQQGDLTLKSSCPLLPLPGAGWPAGFHPVYLFSGELLRKKRRERGGHKDPLLQEISHLQEEVMAQISSLHKEHQEAEKKRTEIDAVALILGLSPSDRPRKGSQSSGRQEDRAPPPGRNRQTAKSPERHQRKVRYRGRSSSAKFVHLTLDSVPS